MSKLQMRNLKSLPPEERQKILEDIYQYWRYTMGGNISMKAVAEKYDVSLVWVRKAIDQGMEMKLAPKA